MKGDGWGVKCESDLQVYIHNMYIYEKAINAPMPCLMSLSSHWIGFGKSMRNTILALSFSMFENNEK